MQDLMLARVFAVLAVLAIAVGAAPFSWKPQGRFGKRGDISLPAREAGELSVGQAVYILELYVVSNHRMETHI